MLTDKEKEQYQVLKDWFEKNVPDTQIMQIWDRIDKYTKRESYTSERLAILDLVSLIRCALYEPEKVKKIISNPVPKGFEENYEIFSSLISKKFKHII